MLDQLVDGAARAIGERLPGPEIDPARWRSCDWWHGPRLFVLVDDYEEEPPPGRAAYRADGGTFLMQTALAGH